jgi:CheY-like chemotaxis protein
MEAKNAQILVAETPSAVERWRSILVGYDILVAETPMQARDLLESNHVDLIICGIHFDDSQALDLVTKIRESGAHKKTPVVIARLLPTELGKMLKQSISVVQSELGISRYIELDEYETRTNPEAALRADLEQFLPLTRRV